MVEYGPGVYHRTAGWGKRNCSGKILSGVGLIRLSL